MSFAQTAYEVDVLGEIEAMAVKIGLDVSPAPIITPPLAYDSLESVSCLLIKDDNLNALYSMLPHWKDSVDVCYIDPPYNTGGKFIYNDIFIGNPSPKFGSHAPWMSFILPRLIMLRRLMKMNGIVLVSIDDYEQAYLKILLDRVFGEECFIGSIIVERSVNGKGSRPSIATNHEYVLIYGATKAARLRGLPDNDIERYDREDEFGKYRIDGLFRKKGDASLRSERPSMYYPLYYNEVGQVYTESANGLQEVYPVDSSGIERRWLWGKEKASSESWKLYASPRGIVYVKNYASAHKRIKIRSTWNNNAYLTDRATTEIKSIFGDKVFDTPKPVKLIEDLLDASAEDNAVILDFFAGTGTTAHAVANINKRDGGMRKTFLIEQPIPTPPLHRAKQLGFEQITDITEQRLRWLSAEFPEFAYSVIESPQ